MVHCDCLPSWERQPSRGPLTTLSSWPIDLTDVGWQRPCLCTSSSATTSSSQSSPSTSMSDGARRAASCCHTNPPAQCHTSFGIRGLQMICSTKGDLSKRFRKGAAGRPVRVLPAMRSMLCCSNGGSKLPRNE